MRKLAAFWLLLLTIATVYAQTNLPVRLALISESDDAAAAVDVLTAQLANNNRIQLLERDQIDKLYREQGISAANRDDVRLGRVLGADGLLLINVTKPLNAPTFAAAQSLSPENLTMRLIAVKPGVILTEATISWSAKDALPWAQSTAAHLDSFLPKLTVIAKDAIPLSVVNLSSSIQSADALNAERELKLLTIQRLSQEPQFFVLERQKMELLGEEKNLKSDETPFWDGSYLLDGTIDQNGYSKDTITINARLRPPHGGAPLLFEVSGSRTNLADVINSMAIKVAELLKVNPAIKQWDAASESAQYFDEATWALKWGVLSEAQAAADSAWALGKKDLPCALVRVKAYTSDVSAHVQTYQTLESGQAPTYSNGKPVTSPPSEADLIRDITENSAHHRVTRYEVYESSDGAWTIKYVFTDTPPDSKNADRALHALELYYEFSRTSPDGQPKILTHGAHWNDWHNSEWYELGIADLEAASHVLQDFNFDPASRPLVDDKLSDLRALARSVATLISQSPSIHDGYYVGGRLAPRDDLYHTMQESPNIFRCEVNWGCFWQERPEDTISLYRELMSSSVFSYIHNDFWNRTVLQPRLIAWNDEDARRIPVIWGNFMQELNGSTNVFWNMEARALKAADATNDLETAVAVTNLINGILQNRGAFVTNNVEVMYLDWGVGDLVYNMPARGTPTDAKESFVQLYNTNYYRQFEAMDNEYTEKTILALKTAEAFEKQKQYLASFTPYGFSTFVDIFSERNYTTSQAAELLPLVVAYESNMVANATGQQKFFAKANAQFISGLLQRPIHQILNPPAAQPAIRRPGPVPVAIVAAAIPPAANTREIVTNVITIGKFLPISLDGLPGDWQSVEQNNPLSDITIRAHQWAEGKLVLDFDYGANLYTYDDQGNWKSTRGASLPAIAILDPSTDQWNLIACPEADIYSRSTFYNRTVLLNGELFNSDGNQIRKYDFVSRQWKVLKVSGGNNYELFAINSRLYAANQHIIFEISNDGKSSRILASTRRRPAVSALDNLEDFGRQPVLFAGANHSLLVFAGNTIYRWDQDDWHAENRIPDSDIRPDVFAGGILFRSHWEGRSNDRDNIGSYFYDNSASLSRLEPQAASPELCLWQKFRRLNTGQSFLLTNAVNSPEPLWQMPPGMHIDALSAALDSSNLYLLADHLNARGTNTSDTYDAELMCFSQGLPQAQKLFLKFNSLDGCTPLAPINPNMPDFPGTSQTWLLPTANGLIFGKESPFNLLPVGVGDNSTCKAGVWLLPASQLVPAIAAQKQVQQIQVNQSRADAEKASTDLIAKYDHNHNGIIDPDEREDALDDPAFIESELDKIDANHDGWLEANELFYFDANQNKMLNPKEEDGINIAQHLLALRLMKKFDSDGKGYLTLSEFGVLIQSCVGANLPPYLRSYPPYVLSIPGHNQTTDLQGVEEFLKQQTIRSLKLPGSSTTVAEELRATGGAVDKTQLFKLEVEYYWAHAGMHTN